VAAALDLLPLGLVGRDDVERLLRGLDAFRRGPGHTAVPGGQERYYDDNAWLGLTLVQAAGALESPGLLAEAGTVLRFLESGTRDGGVYWVDRGPRTRHTCSTAPTAELALRLALAGGGGHVHGLAHLGAVGDAALAFLGRELRGDDGLYADHVGDDGSVELTVWSYNQGTPVGAAALRAQLSGDDRGVAAARRTADAALAHFAAGDRLWRQPPVFNAVFFRNLLLFDALAGYPGVEPALADYLDRCWAEARHPVTGWFTGGGIGRYERGGSIDQAGLVQLYSLCAWPRERRVDIC
jgi:hypothetical protein